MLYLPCKLSLETRLQFVAFLIYVGFNAVDGEVLDEPGLRICRD
jgi:hypothetical protein